MMMMMMMMMMMTWLWSCEWESSTCSNRLPSQPSARSVISGHWAVFDGRWSQHK